jgi:hypothetical protein
MYARMGTKSPFSDGPRHGEPGNDDAGQEGPSRGRRSDHGGHSGIQPTMNVGVTGGTMVCMTARGLGSMKGGTTAGSRVARSLP